MVLKPQNSVTVTCPHQGIKMNVLIYVLLAIACGIGLGEVLIHQSVTVQGISIGILGLVVMVMGGLLTYMGFTGYGL